MMRIGQRKRFWAFILVSALILTMIGPVPSRAEREGVLPEELTAWMNNLKQDNDRLFVTEREKSDKNPISLNIEIKGKELEKAELTLWLRKGVDFCKDEKGDEVFPKGYLLNEDMETAETQNYYKVQLIKKDVQEQADTLNVSLEGNLDGVGENPVMVAATDEYFAVYQTSETSVVAEEEPKEEDVEKTDDASKTETHPIAEEEPKEEPKEEIKEEPEEPKEEIKEQPKEDVVQDTQHTELKKTDTKEIDRSLTVLKTDEENHPLSGAKFKMEQLYGDQFITEYKETGADGKLSFENLPIGYYKLTETQCPNGYTGGKSHYIYVSESKIECFDKKIKTDEEKNIIISRSQVKVIDKVEEITKLKCQGNNPNKLDATACGAMSWHLKITLNDAARQGDQFKICFDKKINPGSLTEPYHAPLIYDDKDKTYPLAIPEYDKEKNTITYTLTDMVDDRHDVMLYLMFDSLGPCPKTVLPQQDNIFTNVVEDGKSGTRKTFTSEKIFVDYGVSDEQLYNFAKSRYWSSGFFSKVDRGGYPVYVDYVYYVNMKENHKVHWNINKRRTVKIWADNPERVVSQPVEIDVYHIPNDKKGMLMKRSFPDPKEIPEIENLYKITDGYKVSKSNITLGVKQKECTDIYLPTPQNRKDGYILRARYALKEPKGEETETRVAIGSAWYGNNIGKVDTLAHVRQSASGESGSIHKTLQIKNSKQTSEVSFYKVDENHKPLENAKFALYRATLDEAGTVIYEDKGCIAKDKEGNKLVAYSDEEGKISFGNLKDGTYVLAEREAPYGYDLIKGPVLYFESAGGVMKNVKILDKTHCEKDMSQEKEKLVIQNKTKITEIQFTKYSFDGKKEEALEGAKFKLEKEDHSVWKMFGEEQRSGEDGIFKFEKLSPGRYRLVETETPEGYEKPLGPVMEFYVRDIKDGDVSGSPLMIQKKVTRQSEDKSQKKEYIYKNLTEEDKKIHNMKDKKYQFTIRKVDQNGKPLIGAKFKVMRGEEECISEIDMTNKTSYTIKDVPAGAYTLVETQAPEGYQKEETPQKILLGERFSVPKDIDSGTVRDLNPEDLKVESIDVKSHDGTKTIKPNEGGYAVADINFSVNENTDIHPGDRFTLYIPKLFMLPKDDINIYGRHGLMAVGRAVEDPENSRQNKIEYTVTDYAKYYNVAKEKSYAKFILFVDRNVAETSGTYDTWTGFEKWTNRIPIKVDYTGAYYENLVTQNVYERDENGDIVYEEKHGSLVPVIKTVTVHNICLGYSIIDMDPEKHTYEALVSVNARCNDMTNNLHLQFSDAVEVDPVMELHTGTFPKSYGLEKLDLKPYKLEGDFAPRKYQNEDGTEATSMIVPNLTIDGCNHGAVIRIHGTYNPHKKDQKLKITMFGDCDWSKPECPQSNNWVEKNILVPPVMHEAGEENPEITVKNIKSEIFFVKRDAETHTYIEGAKFELRPHKASEASKTYKAESDADGKVRFTNVDNGRYELWETDTGNKEYYLPNAPVMQLEVCDGRFYQININAEGKEEKSLIEGDAKEIYNMKKGNIKLKINKTDEGGKLLPGATFRLTFNGQTVTETVTNEKGEILIENLNYGEYFLEEIRSPEGYICNGKKQKIVISKDDDFQAPEELREDVSDRIILEKSSFTVNELFEEDRAENTIYPNKAEGLFIANSYEIDETQEPIQPGDYFYLELPDDINVYGINEAKNIKLDIISPIGRLAEGYYEESPSRRIKYVFTNCVKQLDIKIFNTETAFYIDPYVVTQNKEISIFQKVGDIQRDFRINVDFRGCQTHYVTQDNHVMDFWSKITKQDTATGTVTYYNYINKEPGTFGYPEYKKNIQIWSDKVDLKNAVVTIYSPIWNNRDTLMPVSFGIHDNQLGDFYQQKGQNSGNVINYTSYNDGTEQITINFSQLIYSDGKSWWSADYNIGNRMGYVIKTECKVKDAEDTDVRINARFNNGGKYTKRWDWVAFTDNKSESSGELSIRCINKKNHVKFRKVNVKKEELKGAEFELYKDGKKVEGENRISGDNGEISYEGLAPGNYILKEIQAPEGYKIPFGAAASFTVDSYGDIVHIKTLDEKGKLTETGGDHTIINRRGEYPKVGGNGMIFYFIVALILMGAAYRKIRREP